MSELNSRIAALYIIKRYRVQSSWSKDSLYSAQMKYELDNRDTALADRISRCVLEHFDLLDFYISHFSDTPINKIQADVLDILRIGLAQKLYFDRIPDAAIVDTCVSCCRSIGRNRACGFVNAVLRQFMRNADSLPLLDDNDTARYFSILYGHAEWMITVLIDQYGIEHTEAFLQANNKEEPRFIYVNTLKVSHEDFLYLLDANGVIYKVDHLLDNAIQITDSGRFEDIPGYDEGLFYVQDPAAHQVAEIAGLEPGMNVYDCCGAPGGKSIASAIKMRNEGNILLSDIHGNKFARVRENMERLGISMVSLEERDAREPLDRLFDVVIADVPCSGLGVIRNKPEIRYKKEEDISRLPDIQYEILSSVCSNVSANGCLIYSTCTVLPAENEMVIERFLTDHKDFSLEQFTCLGETFDGMATLWPHQHNTDGFFICKMRRK